MYRVSIGARHIPPKNGVRILRNLQDPNKFMTPAGRRTALAVALLSAAEAFYLPGVAPHEYADGELSL